MLINKIYYIGEPRNSIDEPAQSSMRGFYTNII